MKCIGLIGGMSWESTIEYYRIINQLTAEKLGDLHSAKILMHSVDFAEIEILLKQGDWESIERRMIEAARQLETIGTDCLLICTNTIHKVADHVQDQIDIPLIHIADVTAMEIKKMHLDTVGLLGTRFTMEEDFYRKRLEQDHNIRVLIPEEDERQVVNSVIFNELVLGKILPESKSVFLRIMDGLIKRGAQGIILGCTEIPLLIQQADVPVPVFDTTLIHASSAVACALGELIVEKW
jgi:aspartate racemase